MTHKHEVLRSLAFLAKNDIIVEIGSGYGDGVMEICKVARGPVYTIDPFSYNEPHTGGGPYGPAAKRRFLSNTRGAVNRSGEPIHFINKKAEYAAFGWDKPVGLLFVDIGMELYYEWWVISAWLPFVTGYIGITGLDWPDLQVREIVARLSLYGFEDITNQNMVAVVRRKDAKCTSTA